MKRWCLFAGVLWISLCQPLFGFWNEAPSAKVWPKWNVFNPSSTRAINHEKWQRFLNRYVVTSKKGVNLISYSTVSAQDKLLLNSYIEDLTQLVISDYSSNEQLAFWVNLYNALVVQVVLQHMPIASIEDVGSSFFGGGPWEEKLVTIDGTELSLQDLSNRILRPIWNDSRIHYALCSARRQDPNLQKEVFLGEKIDQQMDQAAREYVNNFRGVQVQKEGQESFIWVSALYETYMEDFGDSEEGILSHIRVYAAPSLAEELEGVKAIEGYLSDRQLNGE